MWSFARTMFELGAGSPPVDQVGRWLFRNRLRVLAYHDVRDVGAFEAQIRHLVECYETVSGRTVRAAVRGEAALPKNAVWVTFDDGCPTVVERGQPVLDRYGVSATLFVCPGVIDTDRPFWWSIIRSALRQGLNPELDGRSWTDDSLVTHLKSQPDGVRRTFVERLSTALAQHSGTALTVRQLRRHELRRWLDRGHEVGNHTWDHPCLDRCEPAEQQRQVRQAHDWMRCEFPGWSPTFAYPNGNWSDVTETFLQDLGYEVALAFDHRLSNLGHPLRISRLRVSANAPLARFAGIVSGLHPTLFALRQKAIGGGVERGRAPLPTVRGGG